MKFFLAAAVTAVFTTSASADGLSFNGYGEYAIESETFEFGLGSSHNIADLTLSANLTMLMSTGGDFDIDSIDFGAAYAVTNNVSIYTGVEFDSNFDYTESTIGMSFSF